MNDEFITAYRPLGSKQEQISEVEVLCRRLENLMQVSAAEGYMRTYCLMKLLEFELVLKECIKAKDE
jgi:hypothetical protein